MPSKKLMGAWAFVDVCLLLAGILTLVLSIVWKGQNLMLNFTLSKGHLLAGLILAIFLIVTWAFSVGAIVQPNHVTKPLMIFNWILIVDALLIIAIGTNIWYYTLMERNNYHAVFSSVSAETRIALQDHNKCCGYFNMTDLVEVGGTFCADQNAINAANQTSSFCVTPITAFADMTLNLIFSTVYGYMIIVILLFLATLCVINTRLEGERFRKIDEKRGGHGFV